MIDIDRNYRSLLFIEIKNSQQRKPFEKPSNLPKKKKDFEEDETDEDEPSSDDDVSLSLVRNCSRPRNFEFARYNYRVFRVKLHDLISALGLYPIFHPGPISLTTTSAPAGKFPTCNTLIRTK